MKKEGEILNRDEFNFLIQLTNSLEENEIHLEKAYKQKDFAKFNRLKKSMIEVNKKISEILK